MRRFLPAFLAVSALASAAAIAGTDAKDVAPLVLRLSHSLSGSIASEPPAPVPEHAPEGQPLRLKAATSMKPVLDARADGRVKPFAIGLAHPDAEDTRPAETLLSVLRVAVEAVGIAILLLLAYTTLVRLRRQTRERADMRFRERWRPVLYQRMAGDEVELPELAAPERMALLVLTLELLHIVRDDAADALAAVARERGLPRFVMSLLTGRSRWKREVAIRAAGVMKLAEAAEPLERIVTGRRGRTALSAAAALIQIDGIRGFAAFQPLLWRMDWSPERIAALLKSAGGATGQLAVSIMDSAPPQSLGKAIRLVELLGDQSALPLLRSRLPASGNPEATAAILRALRAFGEASDRATVIGRLNDASWLVRMEAAYALGGLGFADDAERLKPLVRDQNWWVRYRAAQSLLQLSGTELVLRAIERESDRFARDMMQRVLAEQGRAR